MGLQINPKQRRKQAEHNIKQAKAGKAKHIFHVTPNTSQSRSSRGYTSSNRNKKPAVHHYRNIRTDASIVNTLEEFQYVTGFQSRSDLLKEMIKIAKPVFLNSHERIKQFHVAKEFVNKRNKIKHK